VRTGFQKLESESRRLLAIGNRPLTRLFKTLLVVAIAINLLLAIGFDRFPQFSFDDSFFPNGNF